MLLRVALGSLCFATAAHAEPASDSAPAWAPAVEAQLAAGSHSTKSGRARARETTEGGFGIALDGSIVDSDRYVTSARDAGVHAQDASGPRDASADVGAADGHRELGLAAGSIDTALTRYALRWRRSGERAIVDVRLAGEHDAIRDRWGGSDRAAKLARTAGVASLRLPGVHALGFDHDLAIGSGFVLAAGEVDGASARMNLTSPRVRGNQRYLDAYIEDTIRVIRAFDINAGVVIERWSNLGGNDVALGLTNPMDDELPDVSMFLASPTFGVVERIDDAVAVHATVYRSMRAPTVFELYRDGSAAAANERLLPEAVWTRELGSELTRGSLRAHAAVFYSTIDHAIGVVDGQRVNTGAASISGAYGDASWQATPRWLAMLGYAATRPSAVLEAAHFGHRQGSAAVVYRPARSTSLRAALQIFDTASTIIDATLARELRGGVTGFVAVDNLLNERYRAPISSIDMIDAIGAPRIVQVGLRLDTTRF